MQADCPEVPRPAAESGLHHEIEANLIEHLASHPVDEPAQGDRGLVVLASERRAEEALVDGCGKAAALGPSGHGARLLDVDERGVAQNRRAIGRGRNDVNVLEDLAQILRMGEG